MGFNRKLYVIVNCENKAEEIEAQKTLDKVSAILGINAQNLIAAAPIIEKKQVEFRKLFNVIATGNKVEMVKAAPGIIAGLLR